MANPIQREIDKIKERASLDRLIDSSLIHYETQSMEKKDPEEDLLEWALMTNRLLVLEADEKDDDKKGVVATPKLGESTLNPDEFAANVAMLCENHERLIDIHTAISNRAYLYVLKNYDRDMANRFREILRSKFRIHLEPKDKPVAPEFFGLIGKAGGGA
jgi:hypothetical protein